jgi:hypothetical protein
MNNFVKKNNVVIADLFVYFVMAIMGIIAIVFPGIGYEKPAVYSAMLFFIITFFSFGGYFFTRDSKVTYELLIFSLISIMTAMYLLLYEHATMTYALGSGYLMFSVLSTMNKIYWIYKLKKDNNDLWLLRAIAVILLLFISILTIQNFYRVVSEVQTIMIGYYFLSYGLISFVELILFVNVNPKSFKEFVEGGYTSNNKLKKITDFNNDIDQLNNITKKKKKKNH